LKPAPASGAQFDEELGITITCSGQDLIRQIDNQNLA